MTEKNARNETDTVFQSLVIPILVTFYCNNNCIHRYGDILPTLVSGVFFPPHQAELPGSISWKKSSPFINACKWKLYENSCVVKQSPCGCEEERCVIFELWVTGMQLASTWSNNDRNPPGRWSVICRVHSVWASLISVPWSQYLRPVTFWCQIDKRSGIQSGIRGSWGGPWGAFRGSPAKRKMFSWIRNTMIESMTILIMGFIHFL